MHKAAGEDVFYEMEEALIKRILPHSIEAEQSVIGSMILDRDAILVASEILTSDDFYQSQYGIIFVAMVELCNDIASFVGEILSFDVYRCDFVDGISLLEALVIYLI